MSVFLWIYLIIMSGIWSVCLFLINKRGRITIKGLLVTTLIVPFWPFAYIAILLLAILNPNKLIELSSIANEALK